MAKLPITPNSWKNWTLCPQLLNCLCGFLFSHSLWHLIALEIVRREKDREWVWSARGERLDGSLDVTEGKRRSDSTGFLFTWMRKKEKRISSKTQQPQCTFLQLLGSLSQFSQLSFSLQNCIYCLLFTWNASQFPFH